MNVIIVDDEKLTLKMMEKTVAEVLPEAEIHPFQSVNAALQFAETAEITIAFLDIQMRGMRGTELAEKLLSVQPRINIIFCTAYDEYKGEAMDLHASGYLMKPVLPFRLPEKRISGKTGRMKLCGESAFCRKNPCGTNCLLPGLHFSPIYVIIMLAAAAGNCTGCTAVKGSGACLPQAP